ncbi:MAG: type II toxin-antitoxin system HicA family toxin [Planctomycetota bacterium]
MESLLRSLGATLEEGAGSRVRVSLNGIDAVFHRPHPQPEASRAVIRSVRSFLINAGVTP